MFKNLFKHVLLIILFLGSFHSRAFSVGNVGVRDGSHFNPGHPAFCDTGGLGTFGLGMFKDNENVEWVLSNPTCYGFIIGIGATFFAKHMITGGACEADPAAAPFTSMSVGSKIPAANIIDVSAVGKIFALATDCGTRMAQSSAASAACATPGGQSACAPAAAAAASAARCCPSYAGLMVVVGSALAVLGALFETAKITYENARVCGYNWFSWQEQNANGQAELGGGYWKRGSFAHSRSHQLREAFANPTSTNYCGRSPVGSIVNGVTCSSSLKNKDYREFLYGGVEIVDSEGGCSPPLSWSAIEQENRLGYVDGNQRYYMKGPGMAANYACYRYLTTGSMETIDAEQAAFDCCVQRSMNSMCIQSKSWPHTRNHVTKFCDLGDSSCMIDGVGFKIDSSKSQLNVICAETSTLCPYDHLMGGGTEVRSYDDTATRQVFSGQMRNYCQFNKHCVKVPGAPYVRINDYDSAFISSACMNFVGHSQNVYSNTNGLLPVGRIKNFSAPLIECMAETMKNVVQNKAGFTLCADPDEVPSGPLNICGSNLPEDYVYKEGETLPTPSIFQTMQDFLTGAVKIVLVLSVVILGYGILIGAKPIDRRKISVYIVKFACVMYFAVGTGWNDLFIDNVFKISSSISSLVMRLEDETYEDRQLDGCQFPKFDGRSVTGRDAITYPNAADDPFYSVKRYTEGFDYLRPWDVLDCKFVRAIGFGPDLTVPNLILTIFAGLLTGGLGIVFVIFTFIFAFFYIAMIIRGIHIFLVSIIAITLLIFVSPLTITAVMFEKTKNIFTGWLKQLLGFIIQPVILFAYIALFVVIIDYVALGIRVEMTSPANPDDYNGGITFAGDGLEQPKAINCSGRAIDKSLYCIFGFSRFGTYSGLEPIGILLPFIANFNSDKLNTIIETGLLIYIFSQFMDKISDVASELTGSRAISSSTPSVGDITRKAAGIARGVQKRGTRVAKRGVMAVGRGGKKVARGLAASRTVGSNAAASSGSKPDNVSSSPDNSGSDGGDSGKS